MNRLTHSLSRLSIVGLLALASVGPLTGCAAEAGDDDASASEDAVTSSERQAIMDALRANLKPSLANQDIQFDVSQGHFEASKGFAFLTGRIVLRGSGTPANYRGTEYQQYIDEGTFDDHVDALLQKVNGKWIVKVADVGATDVEWLEWPATYGAPAGIFPGGVVAPANPARAVRAEAMDSLRADLKPKLRNQDIVFVVSEGVGAYETSGDWIFLRGQIRLRSAGRPVDYHGTEYQQYIDEGIFDDGFAALLHRENGKLVVKTTAVGPTDVAWATWDAEYGAPASLFR